MMSMMSMMSRIPSDCSNTPVRTEGQPTAGPVLARDNTPSALDTRESALPIGIIAFIGAQAYLKADDHVERDPSDELRDLPSLSSYNQLQSSSGPEAGMNMSLNEDIATTSTSQPHISHNQFPVPVLDERDIYLLPESQGKSPSSRSNTLSSFTEDASEVEGDEITDSLQDLNFYDFSAFSRQSLSSENQIEDALALRVFPPMQQQLVDGIMKDFWAIFDQDEEPLL